MITRDEIIDALKQVKYPGYSRDIVAFGFLKNVRVNEDEIYVELKLSTKNPQIERQIKEECEQVLSRLPGVKRIVVEIFDSSTSAAHQMGQNPWAAQHRVEGIKWVVAIASGKGGVGKSTCAVNIACALSHLGEKTGLLDCDIYGPTIPLMMGVQERPWIENDKIVPLEKYGVKLMSMGFLVDGETPVIWRGPMIMKAIQQFLHQVAWGNLDFLVVDLPPGTGDAQLSLCQTVPLDGGVIVTTPQEASVGVVRKGIAMFEKVNVRVLGIIENMSYYITPSGERVEIFGHGGGKAEAVRKNIPFLGEIPIYPEIRIGGDQGVPVVVSNPESSPAQPFINIAKAIKTQLNNK